MEKIIERMQDESSGVPVRTVKSFLTKIPSVFTGMQIDNRNTLMEQKTFSNCIISFLSHLTIGSDLITWILKNIEVEDQSKQYFEINNVLYNQCLVSNHLKTTQCAFQFIKIQNAFV